MQKTLIILSFILLSACSFPGVYKLNIQQGNIIDEEMLSQLKPGMNRRQVQFVLGNPLIINTFENQSDHYVYTFQKGDGKIAKQTIIVFYENDEFTHFTGNLLDDTPAY